MGTVNFPTRINQTTATAIDNIIIDITQFDYFSVKPFTNDLSDHDAQILTIQTPVHMQSESVKFVRKIDKDTITDFIYKLSTESWAGIFNNNDIDLMYNSFLNTYLRIFHSSFPYKQIKRRTNKYSWLTPRIKTSCKCKRELFLLFSGGNNPALKQYYKLYCTILAKVIKQAKRKTFSDRILKSNYKAKTTWSIVNELIGKQQITHEIQKLDIESNYITNQHDIAEALNKYFATITETLKPRIGDKNQKNQYTYNHPKNTLVILLLPWFFTSPQPKK